MVKFKWPVFGSLSVWPVSQIVVICLGVAVKLWLFGGLLVSTPAGNEGGLCPCCAWGHSCVTRVSQWNPTAFQRDCGFGRAPVSGSMELLGAAGTRVHLSYWRVGALKVSVGLKAVERNGWKPSRCLWSSPQWQQVPVVSGCYFFPFPKYMGFAFFLYSSLNLFSPLLFP